MALSDEEKEIRKEQRRLKKISETHLDIDGIDNKLCKHCNKYHPADEDNFYKKKTYDGLDTYCKKCAKEKARNSNFNYENMREKSREWNRRKENKERIRESHKKYKEKGKHTEWLRNNKDRVRTYSEKRNTHKKHEISKKEWEWCKKYFNYRCAYCGITEEKANSTYGNNFHKEHVDHNGSNRLDNCVPACKSCNGKKHTFSLEDWYTEDNPKFSQKRHNKILKWLNEGYDLYIEPKKTR